MSVRLASVCGGVILGAAVLTCSDSPVQPRPERRVAMITLSRDSLSLEIDDSAMVWLDARDASGFLVTPTTVSWESSSPQLATVRDGRVRAMAAGTAAIIARSGIAADTLAVEVLPPITATFLDGPTDPILHNGMTVEIRARSVSGNQPRQGQYTYIVRDNSVLALTGDATGRTYVRSLRRGFSWVDALERRGTKDSIRIDVQPMMTRLMFQPADIIGGNLGYRVRPTVLGLDSRGEPVATEDVTFTVEDTSIAEVFEDGTVLMKKLGLTPITAVSKSGLRAVAELSVVPPPRLETGISFDQPWRMAASQVQHTYVDTDNIPNTNPQVVSSDTAVLAATLAPMTEPDPLELRAKSPGIATLVITSALMMPDTIRVEVVEPRLKWRSPGNARTLAQGATRALGLRRVGGDTLWRQFFDDLSVTIESSDSTIVRVIPADRQIVLSKTANTYRDVMVEAAGLGTATLHATAGPLSADIAIAVTAGRKLELTPSGTTTMGAKQTTMGAVSQWDKPWRVEVGSHPDPIVVALAHAGPTVTQTVTSFVIPAGATYGTFDVQTSGVGVDSIIASASGFLSDTTVLLVTTPHFVVPDTSIEMERGGSFFRIDVADSLGNTFNTRDTLVLTGSSSDSSVVIPFDPGSIADLIPATWRNGFVRTRMQDTGTVTITIKETSGLVVPLVVSFTAKLNSSFRLTPSSYDEYDLKALGLKQRTLNGYKASSNSGDLFLPKFSSTDTSVLRLGTIDPLDPSILQYVVGGSKPGSASVVVTGPGHVPAVSPPIQVGVPRLLFVRLPDTVSVGRQDFIRVELTDHTSRFRVTDAPVRVRIEEADGGMIPSDADIPAGSLQTGNVPVTFTRAGSLRLVVSELSIGETVYRPDTARLTVSAPSPKTIRLPVSGTVGLGQRVHLPVTRLYYPAGDTSSASVATRTGRTQVPGVLSYSEITLAVVGRRTGEDFVVVSGPGLAGDSTRILVTEGRMSLYVEQEDSLRVGHTYRMVLASTDSTNAVRSVDSETLIAVATSGGVTVTDSTGATLSSIRLIPGAAYSATQVLLKAQTAGEATVTLSRPGYVPLKRALTVKP